MGFDIIPGDLDAGDLNPLKWINKANHAFGDTLASGLEFLGITDPAVDPDGIREIAKQWRALAKGLDAAARDAETALNDLEWEGKAAKALHKRAKASRTQATNMADSLRDGAKALDDFADEAHELLTEIGVILAEIVEFEIAGLALSVLTGGLSAIAGSLAAGARAAKVVALIARIEKSGTRMASVIRTVLEAIRGLERALKALGEIKTIARIGKLAGQGMKFSAFDAALQDPGAFKDPGKLAELLATGAAFGVGAGALGKALGKGLGKLKPSELAKLGRALKLDGSGLSRLKLRPSEWEKLPASIRSLLKKCARDPIDVATGDMLLPQTDVELQAALPLILERTHVSSYRWGGWFGQSWASTLDQRLQADDDGFIYAAPDGARLIYPRLHPDTDGPVLPEAGGQLPLTWDTEVDGALRITDPVSGLGYVFHTPHPTADGEAVDLPLQAIVDRNGQRITIHYEPDGTPIGLVHSGGYRLKLDCHPDLPRISAVRLLGSDQPWDSTGTLLVSYGYNDKGHLTEVTNSSGLPLRFTYDEVGRITSWTDRNNTAYHYTYDDQGRVVRTEGSDGFLTGTLVYDDATRTTTVTDSLGNRTRYEHNEASRLIRETNPHGQSVHQEWDDLHQLVAVTDPLGRTTRFSYDENGRLVSIRRADGLEERTEYDGLGLPTAVHGPTGAVWRQECDERGNRTAVTDPAGQTTRFTYDAAGRPTAVIDPLGNTTTIHCDAAGLPISITDALGAETRYERDPFGRPTAITNATGATIRQEWTAEGHLARRISPDGATESWTYDGEGNCTSHTDTTGAVSHFEYTHFDLLTARTGPDGARYEFTHDTELHVTQVTNPQGLTWNYTYDAAGRLVAESDFDGREQHYELDAVGQLLARTTPLGDRITHTYDALGNLTAKTAKGATTRFEYDATGLLTAATSPSSTLTREHDLLGQVLSETVDGRSTCYTYDALGQRASRTTPSGAVTHLSYDATGNRTQLAVHGHTLNFTHDELGRERERTLSTVSDHVTLASAWDQLGRLTSHSVTTARGTLRRRSYDYRVDGHLSQITDQLTGTAQRFNVDPVGRPTAVTADGWSETYAYDSAGNQTQAHWPDRSPDAEARGERTYAGTRLRSAGQIHYEYDAAGRITRRRKARLSRTPDVWHYTWDAEDRLTSCTTPDGTVWTYTYDPLGRRTAKHRMADDGQTPRESLHFAWDGPVLAEQHDPATGTVLTWDHEGYRPLTQIERKLTPSSPQEEVDARFYAIVTDLVGTPTELVDEHGDIAWHTQTTLWGSTTWNSDATAYTPLRFPGQYADAETALHYNHHRHYDPTTARYTSPDPLGLSPAPNPLTYVHNPLAATDPEGLAPCRQSVADSFNVRLRAVINPGRVFRGDMRHPFEIFKKGFHPKGTNEDIGQYALHDTPSNWVGTSKSAKQAGVFPQASRGRGTWVYEIRGNGYGVDVNRSLGGAIRSWIRGTGFPTEREVIYRNIDPSNIVRAERWRYAMRTGEIIENPGYRP
ncbi:DUF6531 domain-containing protein [Streptomyces sp. NPDC021622]|uniref:DUF6531 domain-containing protein n=1 Tax=Streptomyces sp. NPDC021622 TaxID=3155013 RepID=UPI0033F4B7FD